MTNIDKEILKFEAGEDLVEGDIVKVNSDNEAVKQDSAEAKDSFGIVYNDASEGGMVSVIVRGLINNLRVLVEDTDGTSGYDDPISIGDRLLISGKADGTYVVGQACSTDAGTGATGGDGTIVATAMEAVAGVTTDDTYTTIRAYVNFLN